VDKRRRLEALENSAAPADPGYRLIVQHVGETLEEALQRSGGQDSRQPFVLRLVAPGLNRQQKSSAV